MTSQADVPDVAALQQSLSEAEDALAALQERVRTAQQLAVMGDYDWHIATDTNTWSDQLFRIYGFEPGSFVPDYEQFLSFVHPDDREAVRKVHQAAYASGEPYEMVERIVRADGELRYLASNGQVVVDDTGTPIRFRGTCVDITARVVAEQERNAAADGLLLEEQRRAQAAEITDTVLQGLSAAIYALELDESDRCLTYLQSTLTTTRQIVHELMAPTSEGVPATLTRSAPAAV